MAGRIRTIKPEILEDEVAAGLSDAAWRMWVSSWTLADDHGNLRAGERYLAANVWQDTTRDAATPLGELVSKGRYRAYAVNGQRYVHIAGFAKHQRVDNAGKPRVPGPDEDDGTWFQTDSGNFAAENAMPIIDSQTNISRGSRDTRARIPAAGPPTSDLRPPTNEPEPRASARSTGDAEGETRAEREGVTPIQSVTIGQQAAECYEGAARAALGAYALPTGRWAVNDVVAATNGHTPPGLSWPELAIRIRFSVGAYIDDTRENPKREAGFHPRKWLDWLNGDPDRSATLKRAPPAPKIAPSAPVHAPSVARARLAPPPMTAEERVRAGEAALEALKSVGGHERSSPTPRTTSPPGKDAADA